MSLGLYTPLLPGDYQIESNQTKSTLINYKGLEKPLLQVAITYNTGDKR